MTANVHHLSENSTTPKRRWLQLSLRTLLLAMLVFGCGMGWLGGRRRRSQEAWRPIRTLEQDSFANLNDSLGVQSNGGWLEQKLGIDFPQPPRSLTICGDESTKDKIACACQLKSLEVLSLIYFHPEPDMEFVDHAVCSFSKLPQLKRFILIEGKFTGSSLRHFSGSVSIRTLDLDLCTGLTEQGLTSIGELPYLTTLDLSDTRISDAMLKVVSHSKSVEDLDVSFTSISDKGLSCLKGMASLREISLSNTAITDEGLSALAEVKTLRKVYLVDTKVTTEGTAKLQASRPDLKIVSN